MMTEKTITPDQILAFARQLRLEERSAGTADNYLRHVRAFAAWLSCRPVSREETARWKEHLMAAGYCPATVNAMVAALNCFLRFLGWEECRTKALRLQRRLFREEGRELTQAEYCRLASAARAEGRERLALLMEAICSTGIRVSEVRCLTVEAVRAGRAEIALKGKIRTILIPGKLRRRLLSYAKRNKTASGEIFLTRSGKSLSRKQIWAEMKALCQRAGVSPGKVFPHNLRHLFARAFYRSCRDLARLAEILGHSCVETTRLYLVSTGEEHVRALERLGLIC